MLIHSCNPSKAKAIGFEQVPGQPELQKTTLFSGKQASKQTVYPARTIIWRKSLCLAFLRLWLLSPDPKKRKIIKVFDCSYFIFICLFFLNQHFTI